MSLTLFTQAFSKTNSNKKPTLLELIQIEESSANAGKKILREGRRMVLETKEIIRGGCWDYINTLYNRTGYPNNKRQTILKGKKSKGPYAKANDIRPGDWIYHINHSYHDVGHSGIFIYWADKPNMIGVTLSYGGEHRKKPGRYRQYDLSHVYHIIRAKN